jgi:hypothetical protein
VEYVCKCDAARYQSVGKVSDLWSEEYGKTENQNSFSKSSESKGTITSTQQPTHNNIKVKMMIIKHIQKWNFSVSCSYCCPNREDTKIWWNLLHTLTNMYGSHRCYMMCKHCSRVFSCDLNWNFQSLFLIIRGHFDFLIFVLFLL